MADCHHQSCILWKQHKDIFQRVATYRAKETLELVCIDICGPMKTQSIGCNFYLLTFIDDYSRYTWVYFLKNKSEAFGKFREFKAMVEKQNGKYMTILRSNGGGEYDSNKCAKFCREQGINM